MTKFIVRHRPKPYLLTPQQHLFKEAVEHCGIKKGISRGDLVEAMTVCIPEFYRKRRESSGKESG